MKQKPTKSKKTPYPEVRSYFNTKQLGLPDKFTPGFLMTLDKRSIVYQGIRKSFLATCDDMGGEDILSHARLVMIERFVFGECLCQNLEACIIAKPTERLVSRWISITKVLSVLAVRIGLERKARPTEVLAAYIDEPKKKKKKKGKRKHER